MIDYVEGDATKPLGDGHKFIIHCCNDIGAWGSGFVLALSRMSPVPEACYRWWHQVGSQAANVTGAFELGACQFVELTQDITVVNMIGQEGTISNPRDATPPIRYWAIEECLDHVRAAVWHARYISHDNPSVHCPRFGAGLAGGNWDRIEQMIDGVLTNDDISTTVYDLPKTATKGGVQ